MFSRSSRKRINWVIKAVYFGLPPAYNSVRIFLSPGRKCSGGDSARGIRNMVLRPDPERSWTNSNFKRRRSERYRFTVRSSTPSMEAIWLMLRPSVCSWRRRARRCILAVLLLTGCRRESAGLSRPRAMRICMATTGTPVFGRAPLGSGFFFGDFGEDESAVMVSSLPLLHRGGCPHRAGLDGIGGEAQPAQHRILAQSRHQLEQSGTEGDAGNGQSRRMDQITAFDAHFF